jgi:hypothetical protein
MLLHRSVQIGSLLAMCAPFAARAADADAGPDAAPPAPIQGPLDIVTRDGQEAVRARLAAVVVELRRTLPPPPGFIVPGGQRVEGTGWVVAPGRVATAHAVVDGWPASKGDLIEVRGADGVWRPAAVGLDDPKIGLAVLDVPGLALALEAPIAADVRLDPGRTLYGVASPQAPLRPLLVRARGKEAQAWYWIAEGWPQPPGTPLVAPDGSIVAVVGLRVPGDPPDRHLVLPPESLKDLLGRSAAWRP